MSPRGFLGIPLHYLSHSTSPFNSHYPHTPAASSLDDYNSLLTNRLLVSPPPIHCCHSNLPKTPFNHAKPLIKNLHYLFITTRIKSKLLSFLPLSGLNPHFQFIAHSFPTVFVDSIKTCLVTPFIHPEWFLQPLTAICGHSLRPTSNSFAFYEASSPGNCVLLRAPRTVSHIKPILSHYSVFEVFVFSVYLDYLCLNIKNCSGYMFVSPSYYYHHRHSLPTNPNKYQL